MEGKLSLCLCKHHDIEEYGGLHDTSSWVSNLRNAKLCCAVCGHFCKINLYRKDCTVIQEVMLCYVMLGYVMLC